MYLFFAKRKKSLQKFDVKAKKQAFPCNYIYSKKSLIKNKKNDKIKK